MNVLYFLVPLALILAGLSVAAFWWASSNGQFDDVHTPALRVLMDDAAAPKHGPQKKNAPRTATPSHAPPSHTVTYDEHSD